MYCWKKKKKNRRNQCIHHHKISYMQKPEFNPSKWSHQVLKYHSLDSWEFNAFFQLWLMKQKRNLSKLWDCSWMISKLNEFENLQQWKKLKTQENAENLPWCSAVVSWEFSHPTPLLLLLLVLSYLSIWTENMAIIYGRR